MKTKNKFINKKISLKRPGNFRYNIGVWVDYQLKKKSEFIARSRGHKLSSYVRFLMQREIDKFQDDREES